PYIPVVQVPAAPVGENRDQVRPLALRQQPRQYSGVVRGDAVSAHGIRVHGKVDVVDERLSLRCFEREDGNIGIDWASRLDDIGVLLARIPADRLVAHDETTVEAEVFLPAHSGE